MLSSVGLDYQELTRDSLFGLWRSYAGFHDAFIRQVDFHRVGERQELQCDLRIVTVYEGPDAWDSPEHSLNTIHLRLAGVSHVKLIQEKNYDIFSLLYCALRVAWHDGLVYCVFDNDVPGDEPMFEFDYAELRQHDFYIAAREALFASEPGGE